MTCLVFIHGSKDYVSTLTPETSADLVSLTTSIEQLSGFISKEEVEWDSDDDFNTTVLEFNSESAADSALTLIQNSSFMQSNQAFLSNISSDKVATYKKIVL